MSAAKPLQFARLGNAGNTQLPHLQGCRLPDGPDALISNSLLSEINQYTARGVSPASTPGRISFPGPPHQERRSYPLVPAVSAFAASRRPPDDPRCLA
jgi:hypothetical protein